MEHTNILKPAIYSKAQSAALIAKKITKYPEQVCNTPEAFKGLVIEFIEFRGPDYGQPVGSLPEFHDFTKFTTFIIRTRHGGEVKVVRSDDGKFTATVVKEDTCS